MKQALLKLHTAVFLWGFTGVLGRLISLAEMPLVWWRLLLTVLTMFLFLGTIRPKNPIIAVTKYRWMLIGGVIALHWVCFYASIKYANVSVALICLSASALFTALLEPVFTKATFNYTDILLGTIALVGIYLVFHFDTKYQTGIILGLLASLLTVIFSILNKKEVDAAKPQQLMFYELLGGFFLLTLLLPFYLYIFPTKGMVPKGLDWLWLLILSWLCTILAMIFSLQALRKVSAFTQNLTLNLEPVYGILLAFAIYNENQDLSKWFYLGFALILITVFVQMLRLTGKNFKVK
jgi:drug/metabolite transporter (DMT)-like permease